MLRTISAFALPFFFLLLLDYYMGSSIARLFPLTAIRTFSLTVFILLSSLGYMGIFRSMQLWRTSPLSRSFADKFLSAFAFVLWTGKLIFIMLIALFDLVNICLLAIYNLSNWIGKPLEVLTDFSGYFSIWACIAAILAAIPFFSMIYGVIQGKYRYTVERISLGFRDLPEGFDKFRILQISDIHSGSWDSKEKVARGIQMIKDQEADAIFFTGDLVNRDKEEINPFMDLFGSLDAPFGKYAILGNHDYYGQPYDKSLQAAYWEDYFAKYRTMGFDLLLNENRQISREGSSIRLLGVENWGSGRWFPKRGDLDKALTDVRPDEFCILLSHDPSHWDAKVLDHPKHIALTLSGHTHGMQFGINLFGFRWSPVKYRYKRWMGLYTDKDQKLYVNRGFGFLAFPGRVGMWPEITVIELKKKHE